MSLESLGGLQLLTVFRDPQTLILLQLQLPSVFSKNTDTENYSPQGHPGIFA